MNGDIEKRIYELLGVNIFRKYILFTWEKIANLLHIPIGYRIENLSIDAIKEYKFNTKMFALAHIASFSICLPFCFTLKGFLYNVLLNGYCIMVQRYNYIRIRQIEDKYAKHQKLKEQRQKKLAEEKKQEQENILSQKRVNELIALLNPIIPTVDISSSNESLIKVTNARAYLNKTQDVNPLNPNYWFDYGQEKVLAKRKSF